MQWQGDMMVIDHYTAIGFALELLALSPYHRQYPVDGYFHVEIMPPIALGQARFYLRHDGGPAALVTWAWLSAETECAVLKSGRALNADEWNCGNGLFFNDWIAPYGNTRAIAQDIRTNVFRDIKTAASIRRRQDGGIRKPNRWLGLPETMEVGQPAA